MSEIILNNKRGENMERITEKAHNICNDERLKNIDWDYKFFVACELLILGDTEEEIIKEILD
jgi:hypothetical protein